MKRRLFLGLSGLSLLCLSPLAAFAQDTHAAEADAAAAASAWLALLDAGKYGEAWEAAAARMRSAAQKQQFARSFGVVRDPLGKPTTRELKDAKYRECLPGAPDGRYVVIHYATTFENKKAAVETLALTQEPDGKWRVSGYFIR
jgi:hypothetical protein